VEADSSTTDFAVNSTLVQGHEEFSSKVKIEIEQ
jgi:hypothetical protein